MKTYSAKPSDITKQWFLIDATDLIVGRLAAQVAGRLRGKHKPGFTPHMDCGDNVIIVNAAKVAFTGRKMTGKIYHRHTGYPGGIRQTTPARELAGPRPERVLRQAIARMMPGGPLTRRQLRNLRVYPGAEQALDGQSPEVLDVASWNPKNTRRA